VKRLGVLCWKCLLRSRQCDNSKCFKGVVLLVVDVGMQRFGFPSEALTVPIHYTIHTSTLPSSIT
jgi:hypothetical protein